MPYKNATSPKALQRRMRQKQALDLRLLGMSYPEIAEQMNYSGPGAVYNAIKGLLKHHEAEGVGELRRLEARRLDGLLSAHWGAALQGDKDATELVLKISRRRAALLGIDTPLKTIIEGEVVFKHILVLKLGDAPPRLIDPSDFHPEELSREELKALAEVEAIKDEGTKRHEQATMGESTMTTEIIEGKIIEGQPHF